MPHSCGDNRKPFRAHQKLFFSITIFFHPVSTTLQSPSSAGSMSITRGDLLSKTSLRPRECLRVGIGKQGFNSAVKGPEVSTRSLQITRLSNAQPLRISQGSYEGVTSKKVCCRLLYGFPQPGQHIDQKRGLSFGLGGVRVNISLLRTPNRDCARS